MRRSFLIFLAACGGAPAPAVVEPAPVTPAPVTPAPVAETPKEVAPDVPAGADAKRDAELAAKAAPFVDAFGNAGAHLTKDGKKLVFISDRDGLPQLYVSDAQKPGSPATRLVTSGERLGPEVVLTPDGKSVLYLSDKGADENWSIWKVGLDGGAPVELTPGTKLQRTGLFVVESQPDVVYYSGIKVEEAGAGVFVTSTAAPGEEKPLFKDTRPGWLTSISQDGKTGLWVTWPSRSETYVETLDMTTGAQAHLYPPEGQKATVQDAVLSADGKRAFVSTDSGGEQALVLAFDLASGKEVARYLETQPASAAVFDLHVAQKGGQIAVMLDAGNHRELRLLDEKKLAPKAKVKLPLGIGMIEDFSADGRRLTLTWSTPESPNDAFVVDVKSGKVAPLRTEPRPGLADLPAITAQSLEIDGLDGGKIPVHVYLPAGGKDEPRPVIVSYHGGPSGAAQIKWSPYPRFFTSLGYVWVEPNVRGSSGYGRAFEEGDDGPKRLAAFGDVEAVGRWAAAQPWADKDRVVVFGGSYGGYTVLIALTRQSDLWRAGVNLYGITNLKTFMATTAGAIRQWFLVEFGDPDKDGDFFDSISPLRDVDKIVDPLFVYAGANDPRVPRSESDLIVAALRARKVPVEYMVAGDEGHSLSRRTTKIEFMSRAARFLENALK